MKRLIISMFIISRTNRFSPQDFHGFHYLSTGHLSELFINLFCRWFFAFSHLVDFQGEIQHEYQNNQKCRCNHLFNGNVGSRSQFSFRLWRH